VWHNGGAGCVRRARRQDVPGAAVPRGHGPHEPGDSRRQAGRGGGPRALRRARACGGDGPRGGKARVRRAGGRLDRVYERDHERLSGARALRRDGAAGLAASSWTWYGSPCGTCSRRRAPASSRTERRS
jgi:hypothetical protein